MILTVIIKGSHQNSQTGTERTGFSCEGRLWPGINQGKRLLPQRYQGRSVTRAAALPGPQRYHGRSGTRAAAVPGPRQRYRGRGSAGRVMSGRSGEQVLAAGKCRTFPIASIKEDAVIRFIMMVKLDSSALSAYARILSGWGGACGFPAGLEQSK
jgi:hypothetical protein